jgi:hypothetical protein
MEYQNLYQDGMTPPPPPPASPRRPRGRVSRVTASVAAGAVLLGGGAAIGIAATGGASAATAGSAASQQARGACVHLTGVARAAGHPRRAARLGALCRLAWVAAHGMHGAVTVKTKNGVSTLAFERGVVTSASASAVTVRASDGTVWTWDFVASTVVRESGHQIARDKLAAGDQVLVAGPVVPAARDARVIRVRAAG